MGNACKSTKTEPTVGTIAQLAAPIAPQTSHEVVETSLTTEISQSADGLITQKKQEEV